MTSDVASPACARREPETGTPLADVVIPVCDGASAVEGAIASIQAHTVGDVRIVVVNDGSTDSPRQIVERLAADGRVTRVAAPCTR